MKASINIWLAIGFAGYMAWVQPAGAQEKVQQQQTCYQMKNGKIYMVQGRKETLLKQKVVLKDSTIIFPNGNCKVKKGKMMMLKNGACIDANGKMCKPSAPKENKKPEQQ